MRGRQVLGAAGVVLLLTAAGCSEREREEREAEKARSASCEGKLVAADAGAALPSTVPSGVTGATFFKHETQGKTQAHFAYAPGDDVVRTRDAIRSAYEAAGYEIEGSDAEGQAEAEFEWVKGETEGSVRVRPYCTGQQEIRWRFGPK